MKQIKIGVIGFGGRGKAIAKSMHNPDGKSIVIAGVDPRENNLKEFKQFFGERALISPDYRAIIERDDIDAVVVASPDFTHEEQAIAALNSGKDVFLEKPMAISIEGCDKIIEAREKSGRKLMIGFNMRYMAIFQTMKEIVESGVIGKIKTVWVRHFVGGIGGGEGFFHEWYSVRKYANSLLLQKASHDIDMIHWITGSYTKKVVAFGGLDYYGGNKSNKLTCPECKDRETCLESTYQKSEKYQKCALRKEIDVEDNNMVIMELANSIKASYVQCHFTPNYFRNYVFIGDEGTMENLDGTSKVRVLTRRSNTWKDYADRIYEIKPVEGGHGGADPHLCKAFIDYIVDGREPLVTPEDGRMSVVVGCAAAESLRNGGCVIDVSKYAGEL